MKEQDRIIQGLKGEVIFTKIH